MGDFRASIIERQALCTIGDCVAVPLGGFAWAVQKPSVPTARAGRRLSELAGVRLGGDMSLDKERMKIVWSRCKGGKIMTDTLPAAVTRAVGVYLHALYGDVVFKEGMSPDAQVWVRFARNHNRGKAIGIQSVADTA